MVWTLNKVSQKADRSSTAEHWKHILSYEELTKKIQDAPSKTEWEKPFFAIAILTGARKGEILQLKKEDIVWFDAYQKVVPTPDSYLTIYKAQFHLINEKNKHTYFKTVAVPKKLVFGALLNIVFDYWKTLPSNDSKLFHVSTVRVWQVFKECFGKNWYPHLTRHFAASNDTILGLKDVSIRSKFGWADSRMQNNYAHFSTKNYEDDLNRVLPDIVMPVVVASVLPPKVPDVVIQEVERLPDAPKVPVEVKFLPLPIPVEVVKVVPKPTIPKQVVKVIKNVTLVPKVKEKALWVGVI